MGQCYGHPLPTPLEREPLLSSPRAIPARWTVAPRHRRASPAWPPPRWRWVQCSSGPSHCGFNQKNNLFASESDPDSFSQQRSGGLQGPGSPSRLHLQPQGPRPLSTRSSLGEGEREEGGDALPTAPCQQRPAYRASWQGGGGVGAVPRTLGPTCLRVQTDSARSGQHVQVACLGGPRPECSAHSLRSPRCHWHLLSSA